MIELRWEIGGVYFTVRSYVGFIEKTFEPYKVIAANGRSTLLEYVPGTGVIWPVRRAEIWRHRSAPTGMDTLL